MATITSDIGRFGITPEWLLDSGVSDRAIRLFATLAAKYADRDTGKSFPSRATLANDLGCSTDSIDRAMKELTGVGAVTVNHRKADKEWLTSVYLLAYVRIPSRNDADTQPQGCGREPESVNHNQEPEEDKSSIHIQAPLGVEVLPDWYSDLMAIRGFKFSLPHCQAWLDKEGIGLDRANQTAAALKGKWPGPRSKPYTDAWATFRNWVKSERPGVTKEKPAEAGGVADGWNRK